MLNSSCVLQVTGKLKVSHLFQPQFVLPYEGGLYLETSKLTAYQELLRELKNNETILNGFQLYEIKLCQFL